MMSGPTLPLFGLAVVAGVGVGADVVAFDIKLIKAAKRNVIKRLLQERCRLTIKKPHSAVGVKLDYEIRWGSFK